MNDRKREEALAIRVTELEMQLTYLQQTVGDLDEVARRCSDAVSAVEKKVSRISDRMDRIEEASR